MGEDESVGLGVLGQLCRLGGGHVLVAEGKLFFRGEVGALAQEEPGSFGEVDGGLAGTGIDDDGDRVSLADIRDVFQKDLYPVHIGPALSFKVFDHGADNTSCRELFFLKAKGVWFRDPPADIIDAVVKKPRFDRKRFIFMDNASGPFHWVFDDGDRLVVGGAVPEAVEVLFPAGRVVAVDGVGDLVKVETHQHRAESQAVIAMEMGDKDSGDDRRGHIGKNELALGALSRIEQKPFAVPTEQVGSVVSAAGLLLARRTKDDKIFDAQEKILLQKALINIPARLDIHLYPKRQLLALFNKGEIFYRENRYLREEP